MSKKLPTTIEECNAEIEKVTQEIRQCKNRNKMLTRKIQNEEQRLRTHRLIERGAILESIFPELKDCSNEEVKVFLERLRENAGDTG